MELPEEIKADIADLPEVAGLADGEVVVKRGRGRPKGSRSKPSEDESLPVATPPDTEGIPPKPRPKPRPKGKPTPLKMSADNYADVFQALHAIPAGLTGMPALYVTDAEAKPVGEALEVCAEFYGWDFVERFGPAFMLSIAIGALELKVAKRVMSDRPRVQAAKLEAKRRKQATRPQTAKTEDPPATIKPTEDVLTAHGAAMAEVVEDGLQPIL